MGEMEERGEDGDVGNGDTGIEVVTGHNLVLKKKTFKVF